MAYHNQIDRDCYVYRHIRLDKNVPFYIGIGKVYDYRPEDYYRAIVKSASQRNSSWLSITSRSEYEVEIMLENLTWEEAIIKEQEFISLYGRYKNGGTLCNRTDGGEGCKGTKLTQEHKDSISEKAKERFRNEEYVEKYRFRNSNFKHSQKTVERFKEARKLKKNPPKGVSFTKPAMPVVQLTREGEYMMTHKSISSTKKLGYLPTSIVKVCKGRGKYHLGYQWKYLSDYKNITN